MLDLFLTGKYKRDLKVLAKRGYDLELLADVVDKLRILEQLPAKNHQHSLAGGWVGFDECHISGDWLLIYRYHGDDLLELTRTGTHSDLFR